MNQLDLSPETMFGIKKPPAPPQPVPVVPPAPPPITTPDQVALAQSFYNPQNAPQSQPNVPLAKKKGWDKV